MSTGSDAPVRVGIVGLGYWGPNIARALASTPGCALAWACDLDAGNRARLEDRYPDTVLTDRFEDLLEDAALDAVIVATGAPSHHALGMRVLEAGKHAFVEKPLALAVDDARALVQAAAARDRVLMVGHLLRFHPVFQELQRIVDAGDLGRVLYLYTNRLNFGKVRADENALWSLAPHDISLALALAGGRPAEVSARGEAFLREGVEDVVFGYLHFPSGLVAHLHVSWLDPHKSRKLTVVGSEGMAVFDDTDVERKLTIYEKASSPSRFDTWGEFQALRSGDVTIPQVPSAEPLLQETTAFVEAIRRGAATVASGDEGLAVVEVLSALQASLEQGGAPVRLGSS
ncbi:MAG: Gfo/Idh/MocA family oxidoreductase [Actinobacteria bacterium]|nr:Gfo/Idh/MocA family oxidoreductase [Actinomycetota bacterium]